MFLPTTAVQADELPTNHCAIRAPISGLEGLLDASMQQLAGDIDNQTNQSLQLDVQDTSLWVNLGGDIHSAQDDYLIVSVDFRIDHPLVPFPWLTLSYEMRLLDAPLRDRAFTCNDPDNPGQILPLHYPNLVIDGPPTLVAPYGALDVAEGTNLSSLYPGLDYDLASLGIWARRQV